MMVKVIKENDTLQQRIAILKKELSSTRADLMRQENMNKDLKGELDRLTHRIEERSQQNTVYIKQTDLENIFKKNNTELIERMLEIIQTNNTNNEAEEGNVNITQRDHQKLQKIIFKEYDFPDPDKDDMVYVYPVWFMRTLSLIL